MFGLTFDLKALQSPQGFLKFIQFIIGIVCFFLFRYYYNSYLQKYTFIYLGKDNIDGLFFAAITMGTGLIYSGVMALCHIIDQKAKKTLMECLMSFFCGFFYMALGALAINQNQNTLGNTQAMVFSVFCFIQCGLYVIDSIFAFLNKNKADV